MAAVRDRLSLYLVADPAFCRQPLQEVVDEAIAGGVTAVQIRAKALTDREILALVRALQPRCSAAGALLFVNDRVDLALAGGADGVHLGVDDLPISDARQLGGPGFIVGFSPETDDQMIAAVAAGVDYFGVGPVYGTASKSDAGSAIGLETIQRRVRLTDRPVIGIGGITAATAGAVIAQGAVGVAVISAILGASNPRTAAMALATAVREGHP